MCIAAAFLLCMLFLIRIIAVILGLWKEPILHTFERYGDAERDYDALPQLLAWSGGFAIATSFWLNEAAPTSFYALHVLGILLLVVAYVVYRLRRWIRRFFPYPRWYFDLQARTGRSERRRIAYLWLRLSWRTRLMLNSNSRAFEEWADFVIMSTLYP